MKRLLALLLATSLTLCGCSLGETTPTTAPTTAPTAAPTEPPTTLPPTEPPTEPPVLYRNPLNGAPLDAPFTGRATAVVINNIKACLPQYGISQADVYYEIETEGYITRCLALFSDISKVGTVGPVRSARTYFSNIAVSYDAPLVHCGGSFAALDGHYDDGADTIAGWQHIDQSYNGSYFFRDMDRYNYQNYAWEHTLFTTGEKLTAVLEKKGYNTQNQLDFGLQFDDEVPLTGASAKEITVSFPGDKTTTMTYDAVTGRYTMSQYGSTTIDYNTGDPVTFKNVMALYTSHWKKDDGSYYRSYYDLIGSGDGYLAIDGVIVPIKWSRDGLRKTFSYTLADGTPITLAEGNTYIAVASLKSDPIAYQ